MIIPKAPFEEYLKMSVVEAEDGYAKMKLPYQRELTNPHGSLHGGAIVSLADTAMAVAVASKYPQVKFYTVRLEIKFKSPADETDIFAEARISEKKRNFVFGEIKIKINTHKLLAHALAAFCLISEPPAV